MFGLPVVTEIHKIIHKKSVYSKFPVELNGDKKKRFDEDISKITIINELSPTSIHVREGKEVSSIYVLMIDLKKKDYDDKNILLITKLFGQRLVVVLKYGDEYQFATNQGKLLLSEWCDEESFALNITGLDFDQIWENLVIQVSGIKPQDGNSLEEQIRLAEEKNRIQKKITDLEAQARKETQSKKKFEMFQRIKEYQKRLEEMI